MGVTRAFFLSLLISALSKVKVVLCKSAMMDPAQGMAFPCCQLLVDQTLPTKKTVSDDATLRSSGSITLASEPAPIKITHCTGPYAKSRSRTHSKFDCLIELSLPGAGTVVVGFNMVNFHDPAVIKADIIAATVCALILTGNEAALVNFLHCLDGVFLWEFFTTLDFEWDYITGRRKFRWTLLLYSLSRLAALGTTICNIVGYNVTHQINCQSISHSWKLKVFSDHGLHVFCLCVGTHFPESVSLFNLTVTLWTAVTASDHQGCHMGTQLLGNGADNWDVVDQCGVPAIRTRNGEHLMIRSTWSPSARECHLGNTFQSRDIVTVPVATDFAQLIIMLVGLLRSRQTKYGMFRHLYLQGLIWLVAATIGTLPAAIFINLNLNDPLNMMFQYLALFTMEICATRMYRSLVNYNMEIDYAADPVSSAKHSHGPETHDELRFRTHGRGTMAIGSRSSVRGGRPGLATDSTEDWEFTLPDKSTVEKEETELTKMPSLDLQFT
ncbi:hypothetical protein EDB86DRAFT_2826269 [Lactarius hatsudake]|nr:hypothetical protein EDB86DRAFT_2826269 [Lactarius hatsudake]